MNKMCENMKIFQFCFKYNPFARETSSRKNLTFRVAMWCALFKIINSRETEIHREQFIRRTIAVCSVYMYMVYARQSLTITIPDRFLFCESLSLINARIESLAPELLVASKCVDDFNPVKLLLHTSYFVVLGTIKSI